MPLLGGSAGAMVQENHHHEDDGWISYVEHYRIHSNEIESVQSLLTRGQCQPTSQQTRGCTHRVYRSNHRDTSMNDQTDTVPTWTSSARVASTLLFQSSRTQHVIQMS